MKNTKLDYEMAKAKVAEPTMRFEQATALTQEAISADMAASIQEEKLEPKFIFQLIGAKDGKRSEPIMQNWDGLRELLLDMETAIQEYNTTSPEGQDDITYNDDYILLVAVINGTETIIPGTPLITVEHFLQLKDQ